MRIIKRIFLIINSNHFDIVQGHSLAVMPQFDFELLLQVIEKYKVNVGHIVPPILLAIANSPLTAKYDLSSLYFLLSGAAPLGKDLQTKVSKLLNIPVVQGYGLTETSPVITRIPLSKVVPGSVGKIISNIEVKVVNSDTSKGSS